MFLKQFRVGHQSRPRVTTLDQIVAENQVLREPSSHRLMKRIDVINAFTDVGAFLKNVLINFRHFARVGINADVATAQSRETRATGRDQPD